MAQNVMAMLFGVAMGAMMAFLAITMLTTTYTVAMTVEGDATNPMNQFPIVGPILGGTGMLGPETFSGDMVVSIGFTGLGGIFFLGFLAIMFFTLLIGFGFVFFFTIFGIGVDALGTYMVFATFMIVTFMAAFWVGISLVGASV
jgi:hypothetical protein